MPTILTPDIIASSGPFDYRNFTIHRIKDGDTLVISIDQGFRTHRLKETFRLADIDAPEVRGATAEAGIAAQNFLLWILTTHKIISLTPTSIERDKYGRLLTTIYVETPHEIPPRRMAVQELMVAAGHAVWKTYR